MTKKLGDRIRELREQSETYKSLRQFAAALNKSPSWVSKVERNEEKPGDESLLLIAKLLRNDPAELFDLAQRLEPDVERGLATRYAELSGLLRTIQNLPSEKVGELEDKANTLIRDHDDDGQQRRD